MNKTKKSGLLKIAGLMAAVTMLTTCVVSGTMAKYTSTGSTKVPGLNAADWNITAENTNGSEGEQALDTFSTSVENLTWTIEKIAQGADNDAVESGLIAPGTWGYTAIKITNNSEVKVEVVVSALSLPASSSANLTFGYVYSTSELSDHAAMSGAVAGSSAVPGVTQELAKDASVYLYVFFEWKYEADGGDTTTTDTADTSIGKNSASNTFTYGSDGSLTITATQVEPNKVD